MIFLLFEFFLIIRQLITVQSDDFKSEYDTRVFMNDAALGKVVTPLSPFGLKSAAINELPRLYVTDIGPNDCIVHLENIPKTIWDEKRLEISMWVNLTDDLSGRYSPQLISLDGASIVSSSDKNPYYAKILRHLVLQNLSGNTKLRFVMRFLENVHFATNPSPFSRLPTMMDEVFFFPQRSSNWVNIIYWTNPNQLLFIPRAEELSQILNSSINSAKLNSSKLEQIDIDREGFSGSQFRHFMNNLGSKISDNIYLEIGVYRGSTFLSTIKDNDLVAIAIDSWDENYHLPEISKAKSLFIESLSSYSGKSKFYVINNNCWNVSNNDIMTILNGRKVVTYFFDGNHEIYDHYLALVHYLPVLEPTFIFIVDDWNWERTKIGTYSAISSLSLDVLIKIEIETPQNDPSTLWHNGMAAFLLQRKFQ